MQEFYYGLCLGQATGVNHLKYYCTFNTCLKDRICSLCAINSYMITALFLFTCANPNCDSGNNDDPDKVLLILHSVLVFSPCVLVLSSGDASVRRKWPYTIEQMALNNAHRSLNEFKDMPNDDTKALQCSHNRYNASQYIIVYYHIWRVFKLAEHIRSWV